MRRSEIPSRQRVVQPPAVKQLRHASGKNPKHSRFAEGAEVHSTDVSPATGFAAYNLLRVASALIVPTNELGLPE
jgi:hypothetical protein